MNKKRIWNSGKAPNGNFLGTDTDLRPISTTAGTHNAKIQFFVSTGLTQFDQTISGDCFLHVAAPLAGDIDSFIASANTLSGDFSTAVESINLAPTIAVADGATIEIDGSWRQSVAFAGTSGTLKIDHSVAFTGQVSGLTASDALDLADVSYGGNTTATFLGNTSGGTLTVTDGIHTANVALQGNYLSSDWNLSSDGSGGTTVVDPVSAGTWKTLKIGAGGYLTGMDIAPDDTMVVRSDTYGAYIWNGTEWQQLITATSMPTTTGKFGGVYEIRIAPSNSNILYMEVSGYVFVSTNKGATWTQTAFAQVTEDTLDAYRMDGQKMAVDPNNSDVVYVGTPQNGLFVTTNGGATWQSVSGVPVSATDGSGVYPGIAGIEIDPTNTNIVYASSYGNGIYQTTDGGASWSKLIGGPNNVSYAAISNSGVYYGIGDGNSLWSYESGAWTELLLPSSGINIQSVAIDPFSSNEIVVQIPNGNIIISYDAGATWGDGYNYANSLSSTDIPWLGGTSKYMTIGGTVFDQQVQNKLWASDGVGVWNTTNLPTQNFMHGTPVIWNDQSIGIEQLVANEILVPPGGHPVLASWDRPFFYVSNPDAYPSTYGPVNGKFAAGWSLDYASSKPSFVVGIADWPGTEQSGYSTDGGQTWTVFPTNPPGAGTGSNIGGTIAASTPTNIIWAPADGHQPYYTLDGGVTWNPVALPGVSSWSDFDWAYYLNTRTVTADRVLANTFYLYDAGHGVYETTNGGITWTQVFSGEISLFSGFNAELQSVPGEAGNLFFTGGPQYNFASEGFYQSTDQGATWQAIPNVTQVYCFGFGAPAQGQSYPSIYIVGWVNNVYGIWQSDDDAKSWTQIGTYPTDSLTKITTIAGDPNIYGRVYVGFSGDGYAYLSPTSVTAPSPPTISTYSPDTGVANDGITKGTVLTLTGTAVASSTVNVYEGSVLLGTAATNASGGWSFTNTTVLSNGSHSFTATDTVSGVTSAASTLLNVMVDTMAPNIPSLTSDVVVNTNQAALTGAAEANSTVSVYDGVTLLGVTTTSASGVWAYTTAALNNGTHSFTETATDTAGNTSAASSSSVVTIGAAARLVEAYGSTFLTEIGNQYYLYDANGSGPVLKYNGTIVTDGYFAAWTPVGAEKTATGYEVAMAATASNPNHNSFLIWTADSSGNLISHFGSIPGTGTVLESYEPSFYQDLNGDGVIGIPGQTAPTIASFSPDTGAVGDGITNARILTLAGIAFANTTVTIYDGATLLGTANTDGTGAWSFTAGTLSDGTHSFTATDTISGITSPISSPLSVSIDTVAPAVTVSLANDSGSSATDNITSNPALIFSGIESGAKVEYSIDNGTTWSRSAPTVAQLAQGADTVDVRQTDVAGNVSAVTAFTFTLDTVAPSVPSVTSDAVVNTNQVALTGAAEANSTVSVYDGVTLLGITTTNASGVWAYTTAALNNGTHSFTETAADTAGNTSAVSSASVVPVGTAATVIEAYGSTILAEDRKPILSL